MIYPVKPFDTIQLDVCFGVLKSVIGRALLHRWKTGISEIENLGRASCFEQKKGQFFGKKR